MDNHITMTFGAQAVPDSSALAQVADVLQHYRQAGKPVIAVLSALPGVTALLRESIQLGSYARTHNKLLSIHTSAARKLVRQPQDRSLLIQDITDILETYNWMGRSMINRSPTPPEAATILAIGERLSARLLTGHLQNRGMAAVHLTDIVITSDAYLEAVPDVVVVRTRFSEKIQPLLNEGYTVVIGSSLGMTPEGKTTRLSAEGPYQTGSLLAASSGASGLWFMTSRDGILTADPALVPQAESLPVLPMALLDVLAQHGLDVPTEADLQPVVAAQIPVYIRNAFNPTHPGTYIQPHTDSAADPLPVIIARSQMRLLTVSGDDLDMAAARSALNAEQIPVLVDDSTAGSLLFFLRTDHANIARLVLGQALPGARMSLDSGRTGLITLINTDAASAALLARHLDFPAQTYRVNGHAALTVPDESVKIAVEKIHNLTLPQSK